MSTRFSRRSLLRLLGSVGLALPLGRLLGEPARARAAGGYARRLIVLYHPDGIAGVSQNGEASLWHAMGSTTNFTLGAHQSPLADFKSDCVFFRGLSMGPTDAGSHPGGAKKLLTATDGGFGTSIDQVLANTVGADAPFRHLYLGAHANVNNASGDKHISYVQPGQSITPNDDPRTAFELLFGSVPGDPGTGGGGGGTGGATPDPRDVSVIDAQLDELAAFRARLGGLERSKLDLHLEALRDVEKRIKNPPGGTGGGGGSGGARPACAPGIDVAGLSDANLYDPALFPTTLRAQIDLTVQAMACGLTRVGVIQASHHTSELIMSRFAGTDLYDPNYDMRSHQASHYGASHNPAQKEFVEYGKQVRFWTSQLAYLLEQLRARPEDDGTMLEHSIVLFCTEVCDGNTHLHDDMPFVLAGRASGQIATGRLLDAGGRRHADVLVSIARAMGHPIDHFGDVCGGPLPGLTSA